MIFPSKFFLAPINTALNEDRLKEFLTKRSGNGIGVSYVGNVALAERYVTNLKTIVFSKQKKFLQKIAVKILENGSIPGIQLNCRISKLKPLKGWIASNKNQRLRLIQDEFQRLTPRVIEEIGGLFIKTAISAFAIGFKVVQLHGAHGYFLSLMMSEKLNVRRDKYGEDKTLLLEKIVSGIREKAKGGIIDLRLSLREGILPPEKEKEDKIRLIEKINKLDISMISFSNGIYDINKKLIYPPLILGHVPFIRDILPFVKKYKSKIWNYSGNIWDINKLDKFNFSNLTFSIGRSLIADNEFIKKSLNNEHEMIVRCKRCGFCHYYTNNLPHLVCIKNKQLKENQGAIRFLK